MNDIVTRADFGFGFLLEILASYSESVLLRSTVRPIFEKMVNQSIRQALRDAKTTGEVLSPEWMRQQAETQVENMIAHLEKHTADDVLKTVESGLDANKSIAEMQNDLIQTHSFSASRALRVARTETTKAVNTSHRKTYEELANRGVEMEIVWLAAPGARDSHAAMDGQKVQPGEKFVVPTNGGKHAGQKTSQPGGFGKAALDINCRCVISTQIKQPKRKLP